jgi:hypothetical protein
MPKSHVWAHLVDMPATQIVEIGRVVPEPGGEAARLLRFYDGGRSVAWVAKT